MKDKLFKLVESQPFILSVAIAMIIFGFFYWKNFSKHVDDIAAAFVSSDKVYSCNSTINFPIIEEILLSKQIDTLRFDRNNRSFVSQKILRKDTDILFYLTVAPDSNSISTILSASFSKYNDSYNIDSLSEQVLTNFEKTLLKYINNNN